MSNWVDKYKGWWYPVQTAHHCVIRITFSIVELKSAFENDGYHSELQNRFSCTLIIWIAGRDSDKKALIIAPAAYRPLPDIETQVHFQSIGFTTVIPNLDAKAIKG